jgi:signal transduction histidine kinase/ActR/RegA family two-component response regulator
MNMPLINLDLRREVDIVLARQRARQISALLGFTPLDQTRIATATSEIARNALEYAGGGRVEFSVESGAVTAMQICVRERGMGINDLHTILEGQYVSSTGLGIGITGARRLMDRFAIESVPGVGATVTMAKTLPSRSTPLSPQDLGRISADLAKNAPQGLLEELQQQNQELLGTLQELRESQAAIAQMHSRELDETNKGVVALYAELEDGAKALKRLSDLKSRFLSEMSHEFRSPLNSIKGLTGFLLARSDGDLSAEQEKQVTFIRQAADGLSTLVDDLLDLARVEAGKASLRIEKFEIADLFRDLEGTIGPMISRSGVALRFDGSAGLPIMQSDQGKIAQILRNFLTNAVKFTEQGEIRVSASTGPGDTIRFAVQDSGIGIATQDIDRIFEEFGQLENRLQKGAKGIGLGLPLTRKLASLLGGMVSVQSEPAKGSTFWAIVPRVHSSDSAHEDDGKVSSGQGAVVIPGNGSIKKALLVDDQELDRYLVKESLAAIGLFDCVEASSGEDALELARSEKPDVIFLDLNLPDMTGFQILEKLKSYTETRDIPVIINTSKVLDATEREGLAGKTTAILAKGNASRDEAIAQVRASLTKARLHHRDFESAER